MPLFGFELDRPQVFIAMPDKAEKGAEFAEEIIRKVVVGRFSGNLVHLDAAADQMLPAAIKGVIADQVSVMFVDITRQRPNVMFEYGVGVGSKIAVHPIYNTVYRKFEPRALPDVLKGIRVIRFSSRGDTATLERQITKRMEQWQGSLSAERKCSIQKTCPFVNVAQEEVVLVLGANTDEWRVDLLPAIQTVVAPFSLKVESVPQTVGPKVHVICSRCNSIRRSRFVLVDASSQPKEMSLLLGMAYALDKGPLLLKRGSQEWEPSCWQGENVIVFEAVDDLVHHLEHAIDWSA